MSWAGRRYDELLNIMIDKYESIGKVRRDDDGNLFSIECALCKTPILFSFSRRSSAGLTIDHIVPQSVNVDLIMEPSNHQPAHMICNQKRKNSSMSVVMSEYEQKNSTKRSYL